MSFFFLILGETRYYGPHYARLIALKRMLDPHDVFVFPTAIGER